jgi:hypothetical protein
VVGRWGRRRVGWRVHWKSSSFAFSKTGAGEFGCGQGGRGDGGFWDEPGRVESRIVRRHGVRRDRKGMAGNDAQRLGSVWAGVRRGSEAVPSVDREMQVSVRRPKA